MRHLRTALIWIVGSVIVLIITFVQLNVVKSPLCELLDGVGFPNVSSSTFHSQFKHIPGLFAGERLVLKIARMDASIVRIEMPEGRLATVAYEVGTISYTIPESGIQSIALSGVNGRFTGELRCYAAEEDTYLFRIGGFTVGGSARDARLNPNYGDHIAVIYLGNYPLDTLRPNDLVLYLYEVTGIGEGQLRCKIYKSDLSIFESATENTALPIDCGDQIHLSRLTTGEVQVVLGPDVKDKTYTLIFDPVTFTVASRR